MKPFRMHPEPSVEDQAALWAARLEESTLDANGSSELNAWLGEDSSRRALLAHYCQLSIDLDELLPELVASGRVEIPAYLAPARKRWGMKWIASGALAAAAIAVAVLWIGRTGLHPETIATSLAQRRSFTLSDGTHVELNANTSILVENGRAERRVRLADGEAFFEVSKDKARPFIVDTPGGSVRVTGTRFDVRTDAGSELDVTVVEGSVQVRPGETANYQAPDPVNLTPGDHLSAGSAGVNLRPLSAGALADALAWREGKIVFDAVPLSEALARIARYHGKSITATPGAAVLLLGGRMSLDHLDGFFVDLEAALPEVRVTRDAGGGARVSLRSEN
jgi:transmembrane sensor